MTMRSHRISIAALSVLTLAVVLAGAALAWACAPQAAIGVAPRFGASGSEATVRGKDFVAGELVQIRWETATGPLMAVATGPEFSVTVEIPEASAGVHYITALAPSATHIPSTPFTVVAPSGPPRDNVGSPAPGTSAPGPFGVGTGSAIEAETQRMRLLNDCLTRAEGHKRREQRLARRGSPRRRARARRHMRRHSAKLRRRCIARHGPATSRVSALSARGLFTTRAG